MASPFTVFRRHQKVMLAVVGIGAMVAFVFLDPVMNYMGSSQRPQNPVVVETKYGDLNESELIALRQSRDLVEEFLRMATGATIDAQVQGGHLDPRSKNFYAENWFMRWKMELMGRSKQGAEQAAIETLILSKKAQQMGMVVSDQAINDMLEQLTAGSLSSDSIQQLVQRLQSGRRVSVARLFDAIRTEMLASRYARLFQQSLSDIPPAQKFEYFSRLNRRAKAELLPLAVVDFTSQVTNPSEATLQKFFEEQKNGLPDASSPIPGFKEPRRASFQFFKADFVKFRDEFKPQITDAEISQYYNANKEQFRAIELPETPADQPDAEAKPDEAPKDEPAPEGGDKPAEPATKGDAPDKPADEAKPEATPSESPSDAKQPEAEKSADPQSSTTHGGSMRLVSTQTGGEAPAAQEPKSEPAPAADADKPADAEKPAETPDKPAEPADKPAEQPAATPADDAAAKASETPVEPPAETPAEPKYEPLEKVQDQIRDILAGQKALKRIDDIFEELQAAMRRHADELEIYGTRKATDRAAKSPTPFAFAELAKKYNLEAKEMPLATLTEASNEDIGKTFRSVGFRREPFIEFGFSESLPVYKANVVEDNDGNLYLVWKTDEKASYVPKFADIHDKVLAAWKMIEARPVARKRADELAAQARAAGKPLKEVFADQEKLKVIETGSFSWMTTGNVPQDISGGQPRISQVEGVEHIGEAFMEVVFGLDAGQLGVATNHPQDTLYVVRLAEYERTTDELRDEFAKERPQLYMAVALPYQRDIFMAWLANLEKEADVTWLRPADAPRKSLAEEEEEAAPDKAEM